MREKECINVVDENDSPMIITQSKNFRSNRKSIWQMKETTMTTAAINRRTTRRRRVDEKIDQAQQSNKYE